MSEDQELIQTGDTVNFDDLFLQPPPKKYKVLMLSDHQLSPSGVGTQARFLIEGLIATGKFSFRCLGGAMKHNDYNTIAVNPDFIVKPVDGFGTKEMLRSLLITERPDVLLLFTDPRQFIWVWEMEDEIRKICPIAYWHVWDNDPYPAFNFPWYESTDLINCLSWKTYEMVKERFPEKTNYIPHALPKRLFHPIEKEKIDLVKKQNFGEKADWFKALWVNRNATRKMPSDVIASFKLFLDNLEAKHGHRNAALIMHTDPRDVEGPNLLAVADMLGISENVWFSVEKVSFEQMNTIHNMTDTCINIAKNEGFGLSSLSTLQCGKPVINLKTGGLTRQVVDHRDGTELGVAIEPAKRALVGSQLVPYIYEDYCTQEQVANALMKLYELSGEERHALQDKILDYVDFEFKYENMVESWENSLTKCIESFQENKSSPKWSLTSIDPEPIKSTNKIAPEASVAPATKPAPKAQKLNVRKVEVK